MNKIGDTLYAIGNCWYEYDFQENFRLADAEVLKSWCEAHASLAPYLMMPG